MIRNHITKSNCLHNIKEERDVVNMLVTDLAIKIHATETPFKAKHIAGIKAGIKQHRHHIRFWTYCHNRNKVQAKASLVKMKECDQELLDMMLFDEEMESRTVLVIDGEHSSGSEAIRQFGINIIHCHKIFDECIMILEQHH